MSIMEVIKDGDFVVIQRDNYMRTQKLVGNKNCLVNLSRDSIELKNVIGHPFGSAFRMVPHESKKKLWKVELTEEILDFEEVFLSENEPSGEDNRNLRDMNTETQSLKKEQIDAMREECVDGKDIVEQLIENSASFHQKTKFSQAKFLKKKAKKYHQFIVIKKPSVRLIMQINYKNDPLKMMNLRIDTLAQLLNNANIHSGGKYMIYETGCQGIVVASALERIGTNPDGKIVHIFQTGCPQTNSLNAMNFKEDILNNMTTINMYHLRALEQGKDITQMHKKPSENDNEAAAYNDNKPSENEKPPVRQKQREESINSYEVLKQKKMDGLIIACKQHPSNILLALMKYLSYSRPFVVFSPYKEPLLETYFAIKETGQALMVSITESWLRNYQVLPDRTHPEVLMSGGGGYILSGIYVDNSNPEGYTISNNGDSNNHNQHRKKRRY